MASHDLIDAHLGGTARRPLATGWLFCLAWGTSLAAAPTSASA